MNRLITESRGKILHLLSEGMSIRAIGRTMGVSKNTISKLLIDSGNPRIFRAELHCYALLPAAAKTKSPYVRLILTTPVVM